MSGKYDDGLRQVMADRHRGAAAEGIELPDAAGAFPGTWLPSVWPFVVDTNALGNDLARSARDGRTVLVSGAVTGAVRLFCPRHVTDEMVEHMAQWAKRARRPVDEIAALWEREYLPILRVVDVPDGMLYLDEEARIAILATAEHQHGDPDDVPTARLALLLDAPLLTKDHNLMRAVYGPTWDVAAHGEWLDTLRAGGDTGPLGEIIMAGYLLVTGVTVGTYRLVAKLVELFGWPLVGAAGAVGALVARHILSPSTKTKIVEGTKTALIEGIDLLGTMATSYTGAQAQVTTMAPGSSPQRPGAAGDGVLHRACLHDLARARGSHVSAHELSRDLDIADTAHGETKVREVLRTNSAVVEVYPGRFQLGCALVRQPPTSPHELGQ